MFHLVQVQTLAGSHQDFHGVLLKPLLCKSFTIKYCTYLPFYAVFTWFQSVSFSCRCGVRKINLNLKHAENLKVYESFLSAFKVHKDDQTSWSTLTFTCSAMVLHVLFSVKIKMFLSHHVAYYYWSRWSSVSQEHNSPLVVWSGIAMRFSPSPFIVHSAVVSGSFFQHSRSTVYTSVWSEVLLLHWVA